MEKERDKLLNRLLFSHIQYTWRWLFMWIYGYDNNTLLLLLCFVLCRKRLYFSPSPSPSPFPFFYFFFGSGSFDKEKWNLCFWKINFLSVFDGPLVYLMHNFHMNVSYSSFYFCSLNLKPKWRNKNKIHREVFFFRHNFLSSMWFRWRKATFGNRNFLIFHPHDLNFFLLENNWIIMCHVVLAEWDKKIPLENDLNVEDCLAKYWICS